MQIVRLTKNEFSKWSEEIEKLLNETAAINFPNNCVDESFGHLRCMKVEGYLDDGSAVIFLAIENMRLLGWVWCHEIYRFENRRLHVADIAVVKGCRGQGIGKSLLKTVEQYAINEKYRGIDLLVTASNIDACKFYENFGYKIERHQMLKEI